MKRALIIFTASLILFLTVYGVLLINFTNQEATAVAKNGVVNFGTATQTPATAPLPETPAGSGIGELSPPSYTVVAFNEESLVNLDGSWEFYPGVFVDPGKTRDPGWPGAVLHDAKFRDPMLYDTETQNLETRNPATHDPVPHDTEYSDPEQRDLASLVPESSNPGTRNPAAQSAVLHDPLQHDPLQHDPVPHYIEVPGSWQDYMLPDKSPEGAGTYRLLINVPKDGVYGVKTGTIRTASRIFINGEEAAKMGTPSLSEDGSIPASKYNLAFGESKNNAIELVIHVSSYSYRAGGILKPIKFGTAETLLKADRRGKAVDALIIAFCLAFALYFFLQWPLRGFARYLLYFSGACFFLAVYLSIMNEQLLNLLFDYSLVTRIKIQLATMLIVTFCFLKFAQHFFERYGNYKSLNNLSALLLVMLIFAFNDPANPIFIPMGVIQLMFAIALFASYSYISWLLLKSIQEKVDSSEYIFLIVVSAFSYWLVFISKMLFELDMGYIPCFLILAVLTSTVLLMSHRLHLDYRRARELATKLVAYDKMKDEFLAKTSHELQTPLHLIVNLAQCILEGKKGALNPLQQEDLLFIYNESRRLARLADDLQDATAIESDEVKLHLEPVNPYVTVNNLVEEMKLLIHKDKPLAIKNMISKDFPALNADSDRFKQIIYNLLHNAIKYTDKGTITITASLVNGYGARDGQDPPVRTGAGDCPESREGQGPQNRFGEIRITDTGIGIAEKHRKDIFKSQYRGRVQEMGAGPKRGFGLGLPVAKRLVEAHGGEIGLESVHGEGSCFYFYLPLYREVRSGDTDTLNAPVSDLQPRRSKGLRGELQLEGKAAAPGSDFTILIIDGDVSSQKKLAKILRRMDYGVLVTGQGREVLPLLERNKVDLVILDIMLPDMPGDLVCKEIRRKYSMAELPVLVITASGRITDLMKSFEYGANDFQKQPIEAGELIPRIKSLLLIKSSVEEGLEKEFQYFYSQISPHFLYNTLNTIIGLSYDNFEDARAALFNLSIYLRGKMELHRQKGLITLESELELVAAYLEIVQMRHKDSLTVEWEIDEDAEAMIPPLSLQPLVENSVRHGRVGGDESLKITVSVRDRGDGLVSVSILDNGPGIAKAKQQELLNGRSERLGFTNVVKRINMVKGATIELDSQLGQGTRVTILVPVVKYRESYISG